MSGHEKVQCSLLKVKHSESKFRKQGGAAGRQEEEDDDCRIFPFFLSVIVSECSKEN